jgi:hypothetical protein
MSKGTNLILSYPMNFGHIFLHGKPINNNHSINIMKVNHFCTVHFRMYILHSFQVPVEHVQNRKHGHVLSD